MSQEIHEHSENSTLEPQAMNDLKNVRDDYESSKPEKADHDNEFDKISYISTLDPAARYDISKNHDNVESSILYPSAYNDLNDISIDLKKKKTILLLYLNKNTILHERDNLTETINAVKNAGIDIVLVHEQDSERDWCEFSQIVLADSWNTGEPSLQVVWWHRNSSSYEEWVSYREPSQNHDENGRSRIA